MANPANNAAVLANSFFLMESSSSSSRFSPRAHPCALVQGKTTWMLHSSGGALGFSAATRSIVWNQIFASDPWKYREVGAVQNDERFHPRETQSSSAQRQRRD
jgi:hypothetical protein